MKEHRVDHELSTQPSTLGHSNDIVTFLHFTVSRRVLLRGIRPFTLNYQEIEAKKGDYSS